MSGLTDDRRCGVYVRSVRWDVRQPMFLGYGMAGRAVLPGAQHPPNATISMKIQMLTPNSDILNLIASSGSQKTCALRQDLRGDFRENKKMQATPTMLMKTKSRRNDIFCLATMFYILKPVMLVMP